MKSPSEGANCREFSVLSVDRGLAPELADFKHGRVHQRGLQYLSAGIIIAPFPIYCFDRTCRPSSSLNVADSKTFGSQKFPTSVVPFSQVTSSECPTKSQVIPSLKGFPLR